MAVCRTLKYKIRRENGNEAERMLWAFLRSIRMVEPGTDYRAYMHEDGQTYTHVASFIDSEAEFQHRTAPYTQKFRDSIMPLCEWGPQAENVTAVG